MIDFTEHPHRRYNPLSKKWILCSPHRAKRPWQGAQEATIEDRPYDPKNFLLPGATRTSGLVNPPYEGTYVFQNDFMALLPDTPSGSLGDKDAGDFFVAEGVQGECRVICFHPRHDLTVAEMTVDEIRGIIAEWTRQYKDLGAQPNIKHVQIFENKGSAMGCSNPHPHGQIWSGSFVPEEPSSTFESQKEYKQKHGKLMLQEYARAELKAKERVVCENDTWVCVVPFWALWPFEAMILPKPDFHFTSLADLDEKAATDLADLIRRLTCRYDNLFKCSFPYSMGVRQAPTDGGDHSATQMHLLYYPCLLRSATVKKFMVGFEMLGEAQRDLTAEQAAQRLRDCSEQHYRPRMSKEEYEKTYLGK